jgi:hypothetical protein
LKVSKPVIEELWLLNIDDYPHRKVLKFDEFIYQSEYKFHNQLFIIENDSGHLFVVLFEKQIQNVSFLDNFISPFIICPVNDINKIVRSQGICYGHNLSWIPWPYTMPREENSSEWLHSNLMEISDDYKHQ